MIGQLHDTTQTATEPVPARQHVHRWNRSIRLAVKIEQGKCGWRKHVGHGAQLIFGYLEHLAAPDPERFCWPKWRAISDNASTLGKHLARSQVFGILRLLVDCGLVVRARRFRRGVMRDGYVVLKHEDFSEYWTTLGWCGLRSCADVLREKERMRIERLQSRRTNRTP